MHEQSANQMDTLLPLVVKGFCDQRTKRQREYHVQPAVQAMAMIVLVVHVQTK